MDFLSRFWCRFFFGTTFCVDPHPIHVKLFWCGFGAVFQLPIDFNGEGSDAESTSRSDMLIFLFFFCRMWISYLCQKILSCALTCSFPIEINGMRIASRFQCGIGIGFRSGSTSNFTCEHTLRVGSHDCGFFWKFQTRLHVESVSIPCQKSAVWTLSCPAL